MKTNETQNESVSTMVTNTPENIIARVVLQAWGGSKGDDALFLAEKEVDVTNAVLLLEHRAVLELQDASGQTDEIGFTHVDHSGPLEVYVTDSICSFFGVDALSDITSAAFAEARRRLNPSAPAYVKTVIGIEVIAKIHDGISGHPAFDDLSVVVKSNSKNVSITRADVLPASAGRRKQVPVPDPSEPYFVQALALASAVSINDGAILTSWSMSDWVGEPTNEVLRFDWRDGATNHSIILTEEGIEMALPDDNGEFFVIDQEGTGVVVRFFTLMPIRLAAGQASH